MTVTQLQARQAVRLLKEYRPPLTGRDALRLDFNENTCAPSPRVARVLERIAGKDLTKYPERLPMEATIAKFLGLTPDQALLTNGVDEAIHLVCETYLEPLDEALIIVPTFSMYEIYAQSTGAKVNPIAADPEDGFKFPMEKVLAAISARTRLIAIANPNNPTGAAISRFDLLTIAQAAPAAAVLMDEAYYEFYGQTVLDAISHFGNLFVARTFSKAYGLAGLRAGVLAGNVSQMRMLRKVSSPYNVNAVALACLPEAIADQEFISAYTAEVREGRGRLMEELRSLSVPYWKSHANFVLAYIGERHREFVTEMRDRGILVRDRSADRGCAGCVRITVGARRHNEMLLRELPEVLAAIGWQPLAPRSSPAFVESAT